MRALKVLLGSVLVSLLACGGAGSASTSAVPATPKPFGTEVIVRTGENFKTAQQVIAFVQAASAHQVQVISLLVKQDEDGTIPSGAVYYRSAIAPAAAGYEIFDVLQTLLDAAHARNIRVRAWMPQFHDQVAATRHPDWAMMSLQNGKVLPYTGTHQTEYFVNPLNPAVQAYEQSLIDEVVQHYAVDGVMLDWIRFDNYDMDLSDATRASYQALRGVDPVTLDFAKVPNAAVDQWNAFRTDAIAAYIKAARARMPSGMELGIYILPPEFVEVGQDAAKFNADVNAVAPMCYFLDWGYPLQWFWSGCLASTVAKAGRAEIVPAMATQLSDAQYSAMLSHLRSDTPQIRNLAWFEHGLWTPALLARVAELSTQ